MLKTRIKNFIKDVQRLVLLGVQFNDSPNGGFIVHHNSDSSLVVPMKPKKHLDLLLIEFKESVLGKLNESFSQEGWYS